MKIVEVKCQDCKASLYYRASDRNDKELIGWLCWDCGCLLLKEREPEQLRMEM